MPQTKQGCKPLARRICRLLALDTHGSEIAETAAILPLLFMILLGIFWFGQAYRMYGTATAATRAGAEAAVAPACTTCTATTPALNAQTAVQNALLAAHMSPNYLVAVSSWSVPPPALFACGTTTSAVSCDGTVTNMCIQENVSLSLSTKGGMGTCGTSVSLRYQYPYHFGIPLTNLDLGNLQLPGQAQLRLETQ
jgi:Flp pilus assembly protein TadG